MRKNKKRLSMDIPEEIHNKVKVLALKQNNTITKVIMKLILDKIYLDKVYNKEKDI